MAEHDTWLAAGRACTPGSDELEAEEARLPSEGRDCVRLRDLLALWAVRDDAAIKEGERLARRLIPLAIRLGVDPQPLIDLTVLPSPNFDAVCRSLERLKYAAAADTLSSCKHSRDFLSVEWYGKRYTFAKGRQAETVGVLWNAWESGMPEVSQETIAERIESSARDFRLVHVFRNKGGRSSGMHDAWGTMIRKARRGVYCLRAPNVAPNA